MTDETIADRIAAHARGRGGAPWLLRERGDPIAWRDLGAAVDDARERLAAWGLAPGDVVAGFDDARDAMALACAVLPASATFAPLAPATSADECAALLHRLAARAVLAPRMRRTPLHEAAARLGLPVLSIALDRGRCDFALDADRAPPRAPRARPGHAYVLATSGTTGRPKLVPVAHATMLAYADALADLLALGPGDRGVALAPFHFAGGLRASILLPTLTGGSFACQGEGDVDGFFRAIATAGVTQASAPFAIWRAVLRDAPARRDAIAASRLRFLRTTAGALDPDDADELERAFGTPVLQALGSTEVPGIAHDPLPPGARKRGSVGRPLAGEVRALDPRGRGCAPGVEGELAVRGPLVFDGYLDDAALDARALVDGWMRTGDLGRVDGDGYVFVTGRLADLVNRGGEKIAPARVDRELEALPGVREAAAFAIPHPTLGEELVAAVVPEPGTAAVVEDWLARLRERLPPVAVPRTIALVDALPRNDAGKVERRALGRLTGLAVAPAGDDAYPGALEASVAALWASALGRERVGRDETWSALGGGDAGARAMLRDAGSVFGVALGGFADASALTPAALARAIAGARGYSERR